MSFDKAAEPFIHLYSQSTASNYLMALRSLKKYYGGCPALEDITSGMIKDYERWLHSHGVSDNTSSCYMRSLRSLFNKVCDRWEIEMHNPFRHVYTGVKTTKKRSLSVREIIRLRDLALPENSPLALSRDLFLFCVYACGMPFVDLAHLRTEQIEGNHIVYSRQKTDHAVVVRIEPVMADIINRWHEDGSRYLFPILHYKGRQYDYRKRLLNYNTSLHRLREMASIKSQLSSYCARHSWATLAFEQKGDLSVISKGLGHTDTRVTRIYIRDRAEQRLFTLNKKVIARIS